MGRRAAAAIATTLGLAVIAVPASAEAHTPRPSGPTGLHVVHVTDRSFTVVTHPARHAARYRLYASTVRSDLFVKNISRAQQSRTSSHPRLTMSGLGHAGGRYYYRVQALNGHRSKFSSEIPQVALRPAAPSHLRAASSAARTYVSWSSTNARRYQIEQSTNPSMSSHRKIYTVRGGANELTPYGLQRGRTYYFRVRAMNASTPSSFSARTQTVVHSAQQRVRAMTYNIKEARFDGTVESGSRIAPWSQRKVAAARLIKRASPDVIGIEEGAALIGHGHRQRQVDTLRRALGGTYALAHTEIPPRKPGTRRTGVYVLYKKALFHKAGKGGHWALGDHRWAAHQVLRNRRTGAKFLVCVAHLLPQSGRAADVKRRAETRRLVTKGHALAARRGVPVFYLGDFNSDPFRHHAFNAPAQVMRAHNIADAYNVAQHRRNARYNTANHYMRRPPHVGARIDYVFAPQGVGVQSWQLVMRLRHGQFVGTIPSDHNPVVSNLEIPYGH